MQVMGKLLCNAATASEEGRAGAGLQQDLIHYFAIAMNEVQVLLGHASMVQQSDKLFRNYRYPALINNAEHRQGFLRVSLAYVYNNPCLQCGLDECLSMHSRRISP